MIVFDLDNTLRDVGDDKHVTPYTLKTDPCDPRNWVPWQEFANENGVPIQPIVDLYHELIDLDTTVIFTSSQFGTKDWLSRYNIRHPAEVLERQPGDGSSGVDYKRDFIDRNRHQIILWVDDHEETCQYVESLGIQVVRVCK